MSSAPLVQELIPAPSLEEAFRKLCNRRGMILFDSSLPQSDLSRYSFLAADPFELFEVSQPEFRLDPFAEVSQKLDEFKTPSLPGLPPFQGGAAGLLSYELGRCFERLPVPTQDEFQIPAAVIGLYSWVLAWDLQQRRCWFIGQGFPESSTQRRQSRAEQDYEIIRDALMSEEPCEESIRTSNVSQVEQISSTSENLRSFSIQTASHPLERMAGLSSNFSRDEYLAAVRRVTEYIIAGDIFQANLSQRLLCPARRSTGEQYLRLRKENPAPFAGYFSIDDWAVMSSSPERFLQLNHRHVSTRPIKGTRQRRSIPEADLYTRDELRESEKDRAENVMIVDLLRNDLSRVCGPGTIRVPELCSVEAYETVSHLVSEVRGELRSGATFWDLLKATFPGGSITGAPKIRAMEIITELEQVARGPYCGSLFYLGFDGTADSNILIRTMTQRHGWLAMPAGGGIIAQSDPQQEFEETLHKAHGMLRTL